MTQICKFILRPATVVGGGVKNGRNIVWLNLSVSEIEPSPGCPETFGSVTDRLSLTSLTVEAFLEAVDPVHLANASREEIHAILDYFGQSDDLEAWKAILSLQIRGHDNSPAVNSFTLDGHTSWLDKATRVGLVNSIIAEKDEGATTFTLWLDTLVTTDGPSPEGSSHAGGLTPVTLPIDTALSFLRQLERYALTCYTTTAIHLSSVAQSPDIPTLHTIDIRSGYPEKLTLRS